MGPSLARRHRPRGVGVGLTRPSDSRPRVFPRLKNGKPLVVPKDGGKPKSLTRVTTFIDMEDKSGISDWKTTLLLKYLALDDPDHKMLERVAGVVDKAGEWKALLAIAEEIHDKAGGNDKARRGDRFHELSEFVDGFKPRPAEVDKAELDLMAEYMLSTLDLEMERAEEFCVNLELGVGGTPDRTIRYSGPGPNEEHIEGLFIGDLKTGNMDYLKVKTSMQMAVYARSDWYDFTVFDPVDPTDEDAFNKWKRKAYDAETAATAYSPVGANQDWGILLHFDVEEGVLTKHWLDLQLGWTATLAAEQRYRALASPNRYIKPWVTQVTEGQAAPEVAPAA